MLAWPKWVYDMYDVDKLVQRCDELTFLKQGLRKGNRKGTFNEMSYFEVNISF